jgi:hypothetical protein
VDHAIRTGMAVSLTSECESGISSKKTFDNLQNTERYSEHPQVPTSAIVAIAIRTNSEEGDDMDIEESYTEQKLIVASCGGRESDTLLPNTRTIQFASSSPDAIQNSIRNPLISEFRWKKALEGYQISLFDDAVVQEFVCL